MFQGPTFLLQAQKNNPQREHGDRRHSHSLLGGLRKQVAAMIRELLRTEETWQLTLPSSPKPSLSLKVLPLFKVGYAPSLFTVLNVSSGCPQTCYIFEDDPEVRVTSLHLPTVATTEVNRSARLILLVDG